MKTQGWGVSAIGFGVLAAWFIACGGEDIPPVDNELRQDLNENYGGAEGVGSAGAAGAGGSGQSGGAGGSGGSGGRATPAAGNGGDGGAAGSGPVGGGGGGDCDGFALIQARCGSAGCHGPNSPQGAFGVSEQDFADFVDEPSTFFDCDSFFIDSLRPQDSLIYVKLGTDFPLGCGNLQMPANGDFLSDDEAACVLSYLNDVAK
jgi:hypothetical protein